MNLITKNGNQILVDKEDYLRFKNFAICISGTKTHKYVQIRIDNKTESLHRIILNAESKDRVDHINHNGLDNRKSNLRLCNQSQNLANRRKTKGSSKYKGVYWHTSRSKWCAQIKYNYERIYLGLYFSEIKAARAYDAAAKRLFGKFALTNFKND